MSFIQEIKDRLSNMSSADKFHFIIFFLILFIGAFFRVHKLGFSVLWFDEACRAVVVSQDDWYQALLRNRQIPLPLLFVFLSNIIVKIFGNTEFYLRIHVALFSIASFVVLYFLVKKIGGKIPATIAMFMMAFHPEFIFYGLIFKQYSMDVFLYWLQYIWLKRFLTRKMNLSLTR